MPLITDIFTALTDAVTGFVAIMVDLLSDNGVVAVFYTSADGLTIAGSLLLLAFGYGLVRFGLGWVKGLISLRRV